MNNDRLFINDHEVDLLPGTVIAITYQINDLGQPQDRKSNHSNTIKLPKTRRNLAIFQHSDMIQSPSVLPYEQMTARVVKDGFEVIPFGYVDLTGVDEFIRITIYSGNSDLFFKIEKKKLRELDLSALDFLWDWYFVRDSRTNTSGVKVPVFNHGDLVNDDRMIDTQNQRPAIFINDIVQQIATDAGFTLDGTILTDERYLKTMMTILNDKEIGSPYYDNSPGLLTKNDWFLYPVRPTPNPLVRSSIFVPGGETWTFEYEIHYNIPAWGLGLSLFEFTTDGSATSIFTHSGTSGTFIETFSQIYTGIGAGSTLEPAVHFKDCDVNFYGGWIKATKSGDSSPSFYVRLTEKLVTYLPGPLSAPYNLANVGIDLFTDYNGNVSVQNSLPDWTQKDFLKMVFNVFGIICYSDWFAPKLYMKQFSEITRSIPQARDWSDKLHWYGRDGYSALGFKIGDYAQSNYFSYAVDDLDSKVSTNLGRGQITVDNVSLVLEKTVVNVPVAGSIMGKFLESLDVPYTQRINPETGRIKEKMTPRILIDDTQTITGNPITLHDDYGHTEDINVDVPLCYFQLPGKSNNLSFDDSLIEDNYSGLTEVLNKSKKLTVKMNLSIADVFRFDHSIPIYLSQFSAYFYVQKIVNFSGNGLTSVELIRLQTDYSVMPMIDLSLMDPPKNVELQEDGGYSMQEDGTTISGREGGN